MTREEYEDLSNLTIEVNAQEYWDLKCKLFALENFNETTHICPKCHESYMIDGYKCFNCGYDSSNDENE